jgi:hypothetical protein
MSDFLVWWKGRLTGPERAPKKDVAKIEIAAGPWRRANNIMRDSFLDWEEMQCSCRRSSNLNNNKKHWV